MIVYGGVVARRNRGSCSARVLRMRTVPWRGSCLTGSAGLALPFNAKGNLTCMDDGVEDDGDEADDE